MRNIFLLVLVFIAFSSCKKEKSGPYTGTVVELNGFVQGSALVVIDDNNHFQYPFLCDYNVFGTTTYSCQNAIFITNLPDDLKVVGKKIRFNLYRDLGPNPVSSSIGIPHDVQVFDAKEY